MTRRVRCLGDDVSDYAAGRLPDQHDWDRHLVTCLGCRGAVELERRVVAALKSTPTFSPDLQRLLLSVSHEIPIVGRPLTNLPMVPPVPAHPGPPAGMPRLAVLSPTAPAQHRSALRAAVCASAAVGASAAAVWATTVTPTPSVRPGPASILPARQLLDSVNPSGTVNPTRTVNPTGTVNQQAAVRAGPAVPVGPAVNLGGTWGTRSPVAPTNVESRPIGKLPDSGCDPTARKHGNRPREQRSRRLRSGRTRRSGAWDAWNWGPARRRPGRPARPLRPDLDPVRRAVPVGVAHIPATVPLGDGQGPQVLPGGWGSVRASRDALGRRRGGPGWVGVLSVAAAARRRRGGATVGASLADPGWADRLGRTADSRPGATLRPAGSIAAVAAGVASVVTIRAKSGTSSAMGSGFVIDETSRGDE